MLAHHRSQLKKATSEGNPFTGIVFGGRAGRNYAGLLALAPLAAAG